MTSESELQPNSRTREFQIKVLGRTLEHLGVQMYKRRDVAIAELVANSWDAGATVVDIEIPIEHEYVPQASLIVITDDGHGMNADQVDDDYLVVGRNRRMFGQDHVGTRPVMGRKGIGKLAGFGIASEMAVTTWRDGEATSFTLDIRKLTIDDNESRDIPIQGEITPVPSAYTTPQGTRILLRDLKHKTPIKLDDLREAIARRFSRTVRGEMKIRVNNIEIAEPAISLDSRTPADDYEAVTISGDKHLSYYFGFAAKPIPSAQLRGFTIYVRGKTAQAPPFYFNVEGSASGQHGTRYLTGEINADFLDEGLASNDDLISTDRQEIDWEDDRTQPLLAWGKELTRRALRDWASRKGDQLERKVLDDPSLYDRISNLDPSSQQQIKQIIRTLGASDADPDRDIELASTIIRAFEYRHFHDVVDQIEQASQDPIQLNALLTYLNEWNVLESRAILEIIKNRLRIIDRFEYLIVNSAPETASSRSKDNLHDLLAGNPWILNPDWQILSEERGISQQLKEWHEEDPHPEYGDQRYDFLALSDSHQLVCIEIKRSNHAVELKEIHRLDEYRNRLIKAHPDIHMVLITGSGWAIDDVALQRWRNSPDYDLVSWSDVFKKTRLFYVHYRDVLEGNVDTKNFAEKERETRAARRFLQLGSVHRSKEDREQGIGPQDVDYTAEPK